MHNLECNSILSMLQLPSNQWIFSRAEDQNRHSCCGIQHDSALSSCLCCKSFVQAKIDTRVNKPELYDYMQFVKAPDIAQGYTTHQLLSFQTIELFDAAPWCCTSPQARCTWHFLAPWLHGSTLELYHGASNASMARHAKSVVLRQAHQCDLRRFTIQEVMDLPFKKWQTWRSSRCLRPPNRIRGPGAL